MPQFIVLFRILLISTAATLLIVSLKHIFNMYGWHPIELGSLHSAMVSGATFVIGFLLSATIADYKESERIPSDFASNLEDMYDDAAQIHKAYPVFDVAKFKKQLDG